jgi:hypothetical protein
MMRQTYLLKATNLGSSAQMVLLAGLPQSHR